MTLIICNVMTVTVTCLGAPSFRPGAGLTGDTERGVGLNLNSTRVNLKSTMVSLENLYGPLDSITLSIMVMPTPLTLAPPFRPAVSSNLN